MVKTYLLLSLVCTHLPGVPVPGVPVHALHHILEASDYTQALENISQLPIELEARIERYLGPARKYAFAYELADTRIKDTFGPEPRLLAMGADAKIVALQTAHDDSIPTYLLSIWDIDKKTHTEFSQHLPLHELIIHPHQPEFIIINEEGLTAYEEKDGYWQPKMRRREFVPQTCAHILYTPHGKNVIAVTQSKRPAGNFRQTITRYWTRDLKNIRSDFSIIREPEKISSIACTSDSKHIILAKKNNSIAIKNIMTLATVARLQLYDSAMLYKIDHSPIQAQDFTVYGEGAHTLHWGPEINKLQLNEREFLPHGTIKTFLRHYPTITHSSDSQILYDHTHQVLVQQDAVNHEHFNRIDLHNLELTEQQAVFVVYLKKLKDAFAERHARRTQTDPSYRYAKALPLTSGVIAQTQFFNSPEKQQELIGYLHQNFYSLTGYMQQRVKDLLQFTF